MVKILIFLTNEIWWRWPIVIVLLTSSRSLFMPFPTSFELQRTLYHTLTHLFTDPWELFHLRQLISSRSNWRWTKLKGHGPIYTSLRHMHAPLDKLSRILFRCYCLKVWLPARFDAVIPFIPCFPLLFFHHSVDLIPLSPIFLVFFLEVSCLFVGWAGSCSCMCALPTYKAS